MILTLNFPEILPISTNRLKNYNFKTKAVYNSSKYSVFQNTIAIECLAKLQEIRDFEADYDIKNHYIRCKVTVSMPNLIAKKGWISAKSLDVDNCLKGLLDAIFKCFNKLDDKMICDLSVSKGQGEMNTEVILERLEMRGSEPIHGLK